MRTRNSDKIYLQVCQCKHRCWVRVSCVPYCCVRWRVCAFSAPLVVAATILPLRAHAEISVSSPGSLLIVAPIHVHARICFFVFVLVFVCVCICACVCVSVCVFVCVCVCVWCVFVRLHVILINAVYSCYYTNHLCTSSCACVWLHMWMCVCVRVCVYDCVYFEYSVFSSNNTALCGYASKV